MRTTVELHVLDNGEDRCYLFDPELADAIKRGSRLPCAREKSERPHLILVRPLHNDDPDPLGGNAA